MNAILKFETPSRPSMLIGGCIAETIESAKADVIAKGLSIKLNLDSGFGGIVIDGSAFELVAKTISEAINRSPEGGEVTIQGLLAGGSSQLEISDDGTWAKEIRNCAFAARQIEDVGWSRTVANCPQGGVAVTLAWNSLELQRMAA